jgi:hypothetical protein
MCKLLTIINGYRNENLDSKSGDWWRLAHEFRACQNLNLLPRVQPENNTSLLHISYFLHKCKKGKPSEKDLPLLEK